MKTLNTCIAVGCLMGASILPLAAQEAEQHRFTANIGGGFVTPVYGTGTRLNNGWNFTAGAGVNIVPHLSLVGEFMFNSMNINSATLQSLQFPGGDTRIWAVTASPVIHLTSHSPVDVYLIGGPGVYHRNVEFTQPTIATFTAFDPFFGVFFPVAVPANQVLLSYATTKLGVNGGAGVGFGKWKGVKFYAEARYHQIYTNRTTSFIPVTFGFRW